MNKIEIEKMITKAKLHVNYLKYLITFYILFIITNYNQEIGFHIITVLIIIISFIDSLVLNFESFILEIYNTDNDEK